MLGFFSALFIRTALYQYVRARAFVCVCMCLYGIHKVHRVEVRQRGVSQKASINLIVSITDNARYKKMPRFAEPLKAHMG